MEVTIPLKDLDKFEQILKSNDPMWKAQFRDWFSNATYGIVCSSAMSQDPADQSNYFFASTMAADLSRTLKVSMLKDEENEDDSSAVGEYKVACAHYKAERRSLADFLKKGFKYAFKHPLIWWRLCKRCRLANIDFGLKKLTRIARHRFIKEGGSAEEFRQYMLA